MGNRQLECTPWGIPTYNVFGWQKPCYLLQEGYCQTFQELIETTDWDELRPRERQPEVPRLHGPLRLRAERRRGDVRQLAAGSWQRPEDHPLRPVERTIAPANRGDPRLS